MQVRPYPIEINPPVSAIPLIRSSARLRGPGQTAWAPTWDDTTGTGGLCESGEVRRRERQEKSVIRGEAKMESERVKC